MSGEGMVPPVEFLRARCGEWVDRPNVRLEGRTPASLCGDRDVDLGVFVRLLEVAVADGVTE